MTVVEYYNRTLDSYFITGRANEQSLLDGIADFQRTGMSFQATATAGATASQTRICRFYISVASPYTSTHFYGRDGVDCTQLRDANIAGFTWEDYDFATQQPAGGACANGTTTVYRGFRAAANGKTSNHRYSTTLADYNAAIAAGYAGEQAALCVSSATAVTAMGNPPSGSGDCGTFYFPGKRISYEATVKVPGATATTTSTVTRTYDSTLVTFNGQSATRMVDTPVTGSPSYNFLVDGPTSWSFLGGRSTENGVQQDTIFTPPIINPKSMAIGQSITMNQTVSFNPPIQFGSATLTGTIVLTSRESVTVPAGTFANACKYTIDQVTTYPGVSTSTLRTLTWIAPNVGEVRTETTTTISAAGFSVTGSASRVATSIQ